MLRAADHERPLVNTIGSFVPPIALEIQSLTSSPPIPDRLLDLFESIPASYLTIHNSLISYERRLALEDFLRHGVATGRLRFIRSFEGGRVGGLPERNDLYAVTKTEPDAHTEGPQPPSLSRDVAELSFPSFLAESQQIGLFIYGLYRVCSGRVPSFSEFKTDVQNINYDRVHTEALQERKRAFVEAWVNRPEFRSRFDTMSDEQYLNRLLTEAGLNGDEALRVKLLEELRKRTMTRAEVLRDIVENKAFATREFKTAFVLLHYFVYLQRDPDAAGYDFWLRNLDRFSDYRSFNEAFAASVERKLRAGQP
jgi:hypothetical protein